MKIKRFFAADIRQAMRMVKEELGADAVIMSNRTVDGGIEIVAARDFDEQSIHNKLQEQAAEQQEAPADKTKKIVLPNFDAAKKRLQLLNSQRKQSAVAFVPEQPVRSHTTPCRSRHFRHPWQSVASVPYRLRHFRHPWQSSKY